jgi:hypothetical protein
VANNETMLFKYFINYTKIIIIGHTIPTVQRDVKQLAFSNARGMAFFIKKRNEKHSLSPAAPLQGQALSTIPFLARFKLAGPFRRSFSQEVIK